MLNPAQCDYYDQLCKDMSFDTIVALQEISGTNPSASLTLAQKIHDLTHTVNAGRTASGNTNKDVDNNLLVIDELSKAYQRVKSTVKDFDPESVQTFSEGLLKDLRRTIDTLMDKEVDKVFIYEGGDEHYDKLLVVGKAYQTLKIGHGFGERVVLGDNNKYYLLHQENLSNFGYLTIKS